MRCKSCLEVYTHPSPDTKKTRLCSICRGIRTGLKRRDFCERTTKILINREIDKRNLKNLSLVCINNNHHFIRQRMQQNNTLENSDV